MHSYLPILPPGGKTNINQISMTISSLPRKPREMPYSGRIEKKNRWKSIDKKVDIFNGCFQIELVTLEENKTKSSSVVGELDVSNAFM